MKTYIKPGFTYKTKQPVKGAFDLEKFILDTLKKVKVPFTDTCCPANSNLAPAQPPQAGGASGGYQPGTQPEVAPLP